MLAGDEVIAVGGPGGIVEKSGIFFGNLPRLGAVGIHYPDVVAATRVAREGYKFPVGAEFWLDLKRDPAAERFGFSAGDRHDVDVAQQIEHDLFSIRAYVEVHPGSFVGPAGLATSHLGDFGWAMAEVIDTAIARKRTCFIQVIG
jgi:hypothetical protein